MFLFIYSFIYLFVCLLILSFSLSFIYLLLFSLFCYKKKENIQQRKTEQTKKLFSRWSLK